MTTTHNLNTCLKRLRGVEGEQMGNLLLINNIDEARRAASENTHGVIDASDALVSECFRELTDLGMIRPAKDGGIFVQLNSVIFN